MKNLLSKITLLISLVLLEVNTGLTQSRTEDPFLPNFNSYRLSDYPESFFEDHFVFGESALQYWLNCNSWRSDSYKDTDNYTLIESLLSNDEEQVVMANKKIREQCRRVLSEIDLKMERGNNRQLMAWIELTLRVPDKLESDTKEIINKTLKAYDISSPKAYYPQWIDVPGANGSNAHNYLIPLGMATSIIEDTSLVASGRNGLNSELSYLNFDKVSGQAEYNLLESHWNGASSWEFIKKYNPDPYLRRVARLIAERLWIDRFLTWSPNIGRITGPGSRMAPSEWLGSDNERALFATGLTKPIWLNFFFDWEVWESRDWKHKRELNTLEATIPDLPEYLEDLAWKKKYPNELQSIVPVKHRKNYPSLLDVSQGDPLRPSKFVNYQTKNYTMGSSTDSWVTSVTIQVASAWWNNSKNKEAPLGNPKSYCVLYPHYVFNGMSFLDKGEIFFEDNPNEPIKDAKGGSGGPWMRQFIDFGRAATLQDQNTMILAYSPRPGPASQYSALSKNKTYRASAAMYLFRWMEGLEGLYINKEPVLNLPYELRPGDWWFIEDGEVYVAVRPLNSTSLKGNCKTVLEARTRHIVLYQDNVNADDIEGITDKGWVQSQSGFVVEMGNKDQYGSFSEFQNTILEGKVIKDDVDGYERHITYERGNKQLEMKWNCYKEEYGIRKIGGVDDPWPQYLNSPEFSVSNNGKVSVKDATLTTTPGYSQWLLSCAPSDTWVAYQSQFEKELPMELNCPAGKFYSKKLPFGKVVVQSIEGRIKIDIDGGYRQLKDNEDTKEYTLFFEGTEQAPEVMINGVKYQSVSVIEKGKNIWWVDPYVNY